MAIDKNVFLPYSRAGAVNIMNKKNDFVLRGAISSVESSGERIVICLSHTAKFDLRQSQWGPREGEISYEIDPQTADIDRSGGGRLTVINGENGDKLLFYPPEDPLAQAFWK